MFALLLLLGLLLRFLSVSGNLHHSRLVVLQSGTIDTRNVASVEGYADKRLHQTSVEEELFLVHLSTHSFDITRANLEKSLGLALTQYLPFNTYLVRCSYSAALLVNTFPGILWVGSYLPEYKLAPPLSRSDSWCNDPICSMVVALFDPKPEAAFVFERLCPFSVSIKSSDNQRLFLTTTATSYNEVVKWIARQPEVVWIEPQLFVHSHNHFANWILQTSSVDDFVLTAHNLDGSGEIIGLGDTGIDTSSVFFHDVNYEPPFDEYSTVHRKIINYDTRYGDRFDIDNGHGTHMAGTLAGFAFTADNDSYGHLAFYNGLAPLSKLAFVDLSSSEDGSLNLPDNLYEDYLPLHRNYQAKTSVNGFGTQADWYTLWDQDVDRFAYEYSNWDFLMIFAAGNDGLLGEGSVNSPSQAKNVLAVGATNSAVGSFLHLMYDPRFEIAYYIEHEKFCLSPNDSAYDNANFCSMYGALPPCSTTREFFCSMFTSVEACCSFSYFHGICCEDNIAPEIRENPMVYSQDSVSLFSSLGPAPDGRIKPDLLAPGDQLWSAQGRANHSDTLTSEFVVLSGTSQAAAVVGAGAALVRQYFRQRSRYPSSALIKASLLHSAERLFVRSSTGNVLGNRTAGIIQPLSQFPSNYQGFGRLQLDQVLFFDDYSTFNLSVNDDLNGLWEGGPWIRCLQVYAGSRIKATLTWIDPAANPAAAVSLVNNLDLVLIDSSGREYRSNMKEDFDILNNVEQIIQEFPDPGLYSILVFPTRIPVPPQSFALVITGHFEQVACPIDTACGHDCNGHGICSVGICVCNPGYGGPDCSLTPCSVDCFQHGLCDYLSGICHCNTGWSGDDCNQPVENTVSQTSFIYSASSLNIHISSFLVPSIDMTVFITVVVSSTVGFLLLGILLGAVFVCIKQHFHTPSVSPPTPILSRSRLLLRERVSSKIDPPFLASPVFPRREPPLLDLETVPMPSLLSGVPNVKERKMTAWASRNRAASTGSVQTPQPQFVEPLDVAEKPEPSISEGTGPTRGASFSAGQDIDDYVDSKEEAIRNLKQGFGKCDISRRHSFALPFFKRPASVEMTILEDGKSKFRSTSCTNSPVSGRATKATAFLAASRVSSPQVERKEAASSSSLPDTKDSDSDVKCKHSSEKTEISSIDGENQCITDTYLTEEFEHNVLERVNTLERSRLSCEVSLEANSSATPTPESFENEASMTKTMDVVEITQEPHFLCAATAEANSSVSLGLVGSGNEATVTERIENDDIHLTEELHHEVIEPVETTQEPYFSCDASVEARSSVAPSPVSSENEASVTETMDIVGTSQEPRIPPQVAAEANPSVSLFPATSGSEATLTERMESNATLLTEEFHCEVVEPVETIPETQLSCEASVEPVETIPEAQLSCEASVDACSSTTPGEASVEPVETIPETQLSDEASGDACSSTTPGPMNTGNETVGTESTERTIWGDPPNWHNDW